VTTIFRTSSLFKLMLGFMVFAFASSLKPAAAEDLGPPVGVTAPDIGKRLDQTGVPRTLTDVMGSKGVVLMFFRSADWCPFCKAQLLDMNSGAAEIEKRGYRIAALSYDSPEILKTFTDKQNISFTFLSDPKSEIIDLYKLRDPQYPPGNRAYGVPRPIIFIVDKGGVIRAKLYEESFKVRPPVSAVIGALDALAAKS
jgi:peroxiredoxin